jgi:hypothetical protein
VKSRKHLYLWVSPATHARFKATARERGVSVSTLLSEIVDDALEGHEPKDAPPAPDIGEPCTYLTFRPRPGDLTAIGRRAAARRMKPATYVAALVRAHIVEDPPLPPAELAVLERSMEQVSSIVRDFSCVIRAAQAGAPIPPGTVAIVERAAEAGEAVRQAMKAYIAKAVASWEATVG